MNSIRQISRLNDAELANCTPPNASWHTDYRDTAYIHIGGLPFDLSEGDVLTIFSQYGNPTDVKLIRDKDSGKSRGFGFLKYEDQRSCDLAVDNLAGATVLGRSLGVDHARYKMKEGERETVGEEEEEQPEERRDRRKRRRTESESSAEEGRPMIKEEVELAKLMRDHDADDPMKAYLIKEKKVEVEEALKAVAISKPNRSRSEGDGDGERRRRHKHHHRRSRRDEDDAEARNGHRTRRRREPEEGDDEKDDRRGHRSRELKSSRRRRSTSKSNSRSPSPTDSEEGRHRRKRDSQRRKPNREAT